jgi:hypothetical protein
MKKIILTIAVLAMAANSAFAQDREIDLQRLDDFNKIELSKAGTHVESNLSFAFPMYFGWNALTNINYKGDWSRINSNFLDMSLRRSFTYGLQLLDMNLRYGPLGFSIGLRWTFMDFTFENSFTTIRQSGDSYFPIIITEPNYTGKKSKIHANYFGIPARLSVNFGRATLYAGASAEYLINGFAKYKHPKSKIQMNGLFNRFRVTVEGGFSYGNLGVFVLYGTTPLFRPDLSDARTLTFGILLGL